VRRVQTESKRRSIEAALTGALSGGVATAAPGCAPSLASSHGHGGARVTYFYRGGKLQLVVNKGRNGGSKASHRSITMRKRPPNAMTTAAHSCRWAASSRRITKVTNALSQNTA
jgi:hypothetical protein